MTSQANSGLTINIDDTILELLPAAVYVCNADGVIVRYNRKAAELWGRSPRPGDTDERFCGAHRLYYPDGRWLPHADTPMADVLQTGKRVQDAEVIVEQPSGRRLWLLVNIEPVKNEFGEVTGAINCFQDISERKQIDTKLKASQAWLQAVVETTPECIKVVARNGTLIHMNPAGLQMIGAPSAELVLGRCTFDLIAPEHRESWRAQHERVCNGESLCWEFDVIGLGGMRRHMETHAAPLLMEDGTTAQLAITRDISERKRQEAVLRESERRSRELLEALPAAIYTTDADGHITFYNQAAGKMWGYHPPIGEAVWCGSWRLYEPNGTPLPHDKCPMAVALRESRPVRGAEAIAERPDGTRVPFMAFPTPLYNYSGELAGAVNMLVDITDRKRAEDHQQLLINELNHRVKNTLATVQSIASQSLKEAASAQEAKQALEQRLLALSRAHDVLTRENWEGAQLQHIIARAVEPFGDRFRTSGPSIRISPRVALALAIAVQELATNAIKYGALSNSDGSVTIAWGLDTSSTGPCVHLQWTETDGPPVRPPTHRGFGSRLLERSLASELNGKVRIDFAPTGVTCSMFAPIH